MKPWKRLSRKTVVDDRWVRLHADTCELPNGRVIAPFYVMEEIPWVHVAAFDAHGSILLTRQYRYAANTVCSELPGGAGSLEEDPLLSAQRELREETGYVADEWTPVSSLYANPARQTNRIHLYLARGLRFDGEQELDDSEEIAFEFVSPAEVIRRIHHGDFSQALHVASYFLAMEKLATLPVARA